MEAGGGMRVAAKGWRGKGEEGWRHDGGRS